MRPPPLEGRVRAGVLRHQRHCGFRIRTPPVKAMAQPKLLVSPQYLPVARQSPGAHLHHPPAPAFIAAMTEAETHRAINAVWKLEQPRLIASLTRIVRDISMAEELAQDALLIALKTWPEAGVPKNPGAWLMQTAKRRAIDYFRHNKMAARKLEEVGHNIETDAPDEVEKLHDALDDDVGDDLLRLIFTSCHPILPPESRVALTLRLLGGLTTEEIARAFLAAEPTIGQRIVRAKTHHCRSPYSLRSAARPRTRRAPGLGAGRALPHLQRRLFRHRRRRLDAAATVRRSHAAGPGSRPAHPGRARSACPGGADGNPGLAHPGPHQARWRTGAALRPGPQPLGPIADPPWPRRPRPGRSPGRRRWPLCPASRHRRLPRPRPPRRRHRLDPHRRTLRQAWPNSPLPPSSNSTAPSPFPWPTAPPRPST